MVTRYVPALLPDFYLADCDRPELLTDHPTYRDHGELSARRGAAIDSCNNRLSEARTIQEQIRARYQAD